MPSFRAAEAGAIANDNAAAKGSRMKDFISFLLVNLSLVYETGYLSIGYLSTISSYTTEKKNFSSHV